MTPDNGKPGAKERVAFIPSQLDDAGLSAAEFRVFCRVKRRGICSESIANIAAGCRLNTKTVKAVLKRLVVWSLVSKQKRSGETSMLICNPPSKWTLPGPKQTLGQTRPQVVRGTGREAKAAPRDLGQTEPHKGSPSKVSPNKGRTPPSHAQRGKLTDAERISLDGERKRIEREETEIKNAATHDAWGPKYSPKEKERLKVLKARVREINELTGAVA